jgi:hypothetical protein
LTLTKIFKDLLTGSSLPLTNFLIFKVQSFLMLEAKRTYSFKFLKRAMNYEDMKESPEAPKAFKRPLLLQAQKSLI